jgi:hypothetical protein
MHPRTPAQAVPSDERRERNRLATKASRERQRAELEAETARIRAGTSTLAAQDGSVA